MWKSGEMNIRDSLQHSKQSFGDCSCSLEYQNTKKSMDLEHSAREFPEKKISIRCWASITQVAFSSLAWLPKKWFPGVSLESRTRPLKLCSKRIKLAVNLGSISHMVFFCLMYISIQNARVKESCRHSSSFKKVAEASNAWPC